MRACMILSTPLPPEEGIGNYVYNVSKKLIERGHDVTVITRGNLSKTQIDFIDNIRVIKAPFAPVYPFHVHFHGFFVNRLFKSLEKDFDIVHIHTPLSPIVKTSLPIVSTVHTSMIEDARYIELVDFKSLATKILTKILSYPLVLELMKKSAIVTTVSNSVAQELKEYYGYTSIVIGNGVDERVFTPKNDREDFILYVGRLSYRKGLFDLIECAKYVCQRYDVSFVIVGKGELESVLKKRVNEIGLQDKVVFLGYVDRKKLIQLYQNASIFVLPTYYEGLPTVLLEAMACGLSVVATNISCNAEVIEDGWNGILIPTKSPEKMAEAVSLLIEDEDLRKKLSKNARRTIESKYTWDCVADRIEKCYKLIY